MKYIILLHKNAFGGIESYNSAIYQELKFRGYDVKIFCFKSPNRSNLIYEKIEGGYLKFFYEIFTTKDNKVIFNNSFPLLLSIFLPVNKISLFHGLPRRYLWFYNFLIKFGNHFFYTNSKYLKDCFFNNFKSNLNFIYPLVRNSIIEQSVFQSENNLFLSNVKNLNLGYLGRISPEKGVDKIILFHNNIISKYEDVKLYFKGKINEDYKKELLKLSLKPNNIVFLEYSIYLNDYFSNAQINFCITDKIETYGIVIAESLLYNVRCVVPDYLENDFDEIGNIFVWNKSYLNSKENSLNFYEYIQSCNLVNSRSLILRRNTLSLNCIV